MGFRYVECRWGSKGHANAKEENARQDKTKDKDKGKQRQKIKTRDKDKIQRQTTKTKTKTRTKTRHDNNLGKDAEKKRRQLRAFVVRFWGRDA